MKMTVVYIVGRTPTWFIIITPLKGINEMVSTSIRITTFLQKLHRNSTKFHIDTVMFIVG